MSSEVLMTISRDEVERARLMSEYKYELDMQSRRVEARRAGLREGRQEGLQEGRQEMKKEIVELLKSGKSPEEIISDYGE